MMSMIGILRRLAPQEILRTYKNARMDLRYGGFLGGWSHNPTPGANDNVATDYAIMPQLFQGRINPEDVLVDVGCGRGRVINWWLSQGITNRIYGLEQLPGVGQSTRRRLRRFENVVIIVGDAIENLPNDGTLFFLFNPFDEGITRKFADQVRCLAERKCITIIYYAPVHINIFQADPFWRVEEFGVRLPTVGRFKDRHKYCAAITPAN